MYALICMGLSLVVLVALLRFRMRIGRAMLAAAIILAILLGVTPLKLLNTLVAEWQSKPLTQGTPYLFVSLSLLLILVNVFGEIMQEAGIALRLVPAMQGLFRSRRAALAAIPLVMGMLPTPGGIMLSAPMVRQLGDHVGVGRSRQAAINFFFRHQWEPVWPLFPAVPLAQKILGISAISLLSRNILLPVFGITAGIVFLLLAGIPPRQPNAEPHPRPVHALRDFTHAFWPIVLAGFLYTTWNIPPAIGIFIAIFGLFFLHRIPRHCWWPLFKAGIELEFVLLVLAALYFKTNLQAAGAVPQVVQFLGEIHIPPMIIIFILPFLVAFLTGVTMPTVAITFPFLATYIGTGAEAKIGLETLAFSGILCGLLVTPVHLCLALSCTYFETPIGKIIAKLLIPTVVIALAGIIAAICWN
ncbi:MAG: DUF401 family protein [Sedimentisphaerales bacterium]|nr:DUF401 family protein [Sedimentisphaerales bacterium]